MWKDERSVFKKYYEYIDKDTKLPKNNNHFKKHVEDYKKAEKENTKDGIKYETVLQGLTTDTDEPVG